MKYVWSILTLLLLILFTYYVTLLGSLLPISFVTIFLISAGIFLRSLKEPKYNLLAQLGFGLIWGSVAFLIGMITVIIVLMVYIGK